MIERTGKVRLSLTIGTLGLLVLLAGCTGPEGPIQTSFYVDGYNHFPAKEFDKDLGIFLQRAEQEYAYVEWQDVQIFRLSLLKKERVPQLVPDPLPYVIQFHIQVESLIEPKGRQTVVVAAGKEDETEFKGIGKVHVKVSLAGPDQVHLERLAIDFDPKCIQELRRNVLEPAYRAGQYWRVKKRNILNERRESDGTGYYTLATTKTLEPLPGHMPAVCVSAKVQRKIVRTVSYKPWIEYWPAEPASSPTAVFAAPSKVENMPQESSTSSSMADLAEIAGNDEIAITFNVSGLGSKPSFLADRMLKTDANGAAELDLLPYRELANEKFEKLEILFRAKKEASDKWCRIELSRDELVQVCKWAQMRENGAIKP